MLKQTVPLARMEALIVGVNVDFRDEKWSLAGNKVREAPKFSDTSGLYDRR